MDLGQLLKDKTLKAKAKVTQMGDWLLTGNLPPDELLAFAEKQIATNKATCIEAIEYATKKQPELADEALLDFVIKALTDKEPRVKWESAKVIANIVKLFPNNLAKATSNLLLNAKHEGTVVRWAAAGALGEIVKLQTDQNKKLVPKIETLSEEEEDNGVKKKYLDALKKVKK
jgi:hypothetical protein